MHVRIHIQMSIILPQPSSWPQANIHVLAWHKRSQIQSVACRYREWYGTTYIHLNTKGYMLAADCTMLFTTVESSCGFSIITFKISNTVKLSVSFCCAETAGLANVSARKSAPHLRNSTRAFGPTMGRIPCMICG